MVDTKRVGITDILYLSYQLASCPSLIVLLFICEHEREFKTVAFRRILILTEDIHVEKVSWVLIELQSRKQESKEG